jgi:hypothetical protein
MRRAFGLLGCVALALMTAIAAAKDPPYELRLIVPAYFYPSDQKGDPGAKAWAALIDSHSPGKAEVLPIANINSGQPGDKVDENYRRVIRAATKKNMTVLAYVATGYAKVPVATVKKNTDAWLKLYPEVGGFFVDEQSSAAKDAEYYAELCAYLREKKKGALLVGNPGTVTETADCLTHKTKRVFDVVILRENSAKDAPLSDYKPPEWASAYAADRFGVILHTAPKLPDVHPAREKKVGYLYVTDGAIIEKDGKKEDRTYTQLPSYWADEVKAVAAVNGQRK